MSNGWNPERRKRQSLLIHRWKPWKTAGVKTNKGKSISKMNAYKHGASCAQVRSVEKHLAESKKLLRQLLT